MLHRWKLILSNWINCYFIEAKKHEANVNIDALLSIISHLRENLNLDESKSSLLEAHTIEEFLSEKYPEVIFENGTVEPANEEQLCISASLLLFFVCVNSKNLDMKNAMCSKLSASDQETILKFSKCLMESPVITVREVQAAITEACGQDIAAMEPPSKFTVTETPPALRSLHSEVRRLQAALDAEKFDRNYLQEELSRTNARMERLLKEKNQQGLEILNLKAKISLCCGESENIQHAEAASDKSNKLMKQLHQLEARYEETQGLLEDAIIERDSYKAKIEELKHERDKWLELSQQENARVSQLSEELELERRNMQSLRDLLTELQQHNKLNRLDTSSLECDDPDTSITSLHHNSSVCSEVCANIIEVQLGEERAKTVVLTQQIETLQEQMNDLTKKMEFEKQMLENVVVQRENDIFNLKHRINEEIEDKNNLKIHCDNIVTKLNNEINELEQKIKDINKISRLTIDKKMSEIQTLQEEKLSLLNSLNNETSKLNNLIKDLKSELDTEKHVHASMKDSYENQLMKLNEKVLNRNNELVELQNSIFEKGEQIETLQIELRNEKDSLKELINKYQQMEEQKNIFENDLHKKLDEVQNLQIKIQQNAKQIGDMNTEIEQLKASVSSTNDKCKTLEDLKEQLITEVKNRDAKIEENLKDIDHINKVFQKEKQKLLQDIDERNATVYSLQTQLQNEIHFKVGLQNELTQSKSENVTLSKEIEKVNIELSKLKLEIENKDKIIGSMDLYIQEGKKHIEEANKKIEHMSAKIINKEAEIKHLNDKLDATIVSLQNEIQNNKDNTEVAQTKLLAEIAERESLKAQIDSMLKEKSDIEKELSAKSEDLIVLKDNYNKLSQKFEDNKLSLEKNNVDLHNECMSKNKLLCEKEIELESLQCEIVELKFGNENLAKEVDIKTEVIKNLEQDNQQLQFFIEKEKSSHEDVIKEKNDIIYKLDIQVKDKIVEMDDLRQSSEELKSSFEKHKMEKEKKVAELKEIALNLEQKINQVEREKVELTKTIGNVEENLKISIENQATEYKIYRDSLESEKEEIMLKNKTLASEIECLISDNATLKLQLTDEESKNATLINDNKLLLSNNECLLQDKAILTQKLADEISEKKVLEEEKYILLTEKNAIKDQLSKKMNVLKSTLEEKDCLTQQLIEEKSAKEISEKEKELLAAEKELIERQSVESDKIKSELCHEIYALNKQKDTLQDELIELKKTLEVLNNEYQKLKEELHKEKVYNNKLLQENQNILNENDKLKRDLLNANTAHVVLSDEKETLEKCLINEKSIYDEIKFAKESIEKKNLVLMAEKKLLEERLIENENIKSELYSKLDKVNQEIENMQQELDKEKETMLTITDNNNCLTDNLNQQISAYENLFKKHESLVEINNNLNKELQTANTVHKLLKAEKETLEKSLNNEKHMHDELEAEKNNLALKLQLELVNKDEEIEKLLEKYEKLKKEFEENKLFQQVLITEKESKEEEIRQLIVQCDELKEICNVIKQAQECGTREQNKTITEYTNLLNKYNKLKQSYSEIENAYKTLSEAKHIEQNRQIEEYEKLKQTFEENKKAYDILLKEQESLLLDMDNAQKVFATEKEHLDKALNAEKFSHDQIQSEKNSLAIKFELDIINKEEEIKTLLEENEKLKSMLVEEKSVQDTINTEIKTIVDEKSTLATSLSLEKLAREEIEREKIDLELKLEDLLTKYHDLEEQNNNVLSTVKENLVNLAEKLKVEDQIHDVLQNIDIENVKDMSVSETHNIMFHITNNLASELSSLKKSEFDNKIELKNAQEMLKMKENEMIELQTEIKKLQQTNYEHKTEHTKQSESYITSMNSKIRDIQTLQQENQTLQNDLDDVKVQLEVKVKSLKEKLIDNENLTDKLKHSYESQIDNLNIMLTKLTNYLKEKTVELEGMRKEKEVLQQTVTDSCRVIKTLEEEVKTEKQNIDKMISDFDSERQVLKNMVTVTESVMEDEKIRLNNIISEHVSEKDSLQAENNLLKNNLTDIEKKCRDQELANTSLLVLLRLAREAKEDVEKESEYVRDYLDEVVTYLSKERNTNISVISALEYQEKTLAGDYEKIKNDLETAQKLNTELKTNQNELENEIRTLKDKLEIVLQDKSKIQNELQAQLTQELQEKNQFEKMLIEKSQNLNVVQLEIKELKNKVIDLAKEKMNLELEKKENADKIAKLSTTIETMKSDHNKEIAKLENENQQLVTVVGENKTVIKNMEQLIKHELEENHKLRDNIEHEKLELNNKCSLLQDYQNKAEKVLEDRQKEIVNLRKEIGTLQNKIDICEQESKEKDEVVTKVNKEKDAIINMMRQELVEVKCVKEMFEKELEAKKSVIAELQNDMEINKLRKENEQLLKVIGQQETLPAQNQENTANKYSQGEKSAQYKVDNSSSDNMHSSIESLKTITDLEKIIHDKNRTITSLQTDLTYVKSLVADSETNLLDVKKELEVSQENCQQLSSQLKKIVYQKNEEIADLKKQVAKMSVTETRASQIIKVSAKYQAMILKRIAEIKSNTILKELTNFGNSNNSDNELKRSLNAGTITMEDLENFLDTTDRHLRRCSEKQIALQKERDRLVEVNRINESEIINMKKFLTELSISFQTFSSVKELYGQRLSRVISVQRTVRREILNLDGRVGVSVMCKLERGYGAAMQDLTECTMNLQRWVERCISRTVSVEKIKQAFTSDLERSSLASPTFQNTGLEIQLDELEKSFQKLLEEVARAVKSEGGKEAQASTIMEVRAEYEDKLNRMKAKMKDLFNEQMALLKNKQAEEIGLLERELQKYRTQMEESKRAYENHIKELTKELWKVGEKYLVKNDEAEWLKKKQRSGSLMSLQHVHSSGLAAPPELPSRPSDAYSLRSLPLVPDHNTKNKREGRGLHMSDEEGEVFDNRCLKELASTPQRDLPHGYRLSELKFRNSLCPPHLKSSYPAETQFAPVLDEEEIKAGVSAPVRPQRKEVGITAYKKPGPPTPSKQAGRLSATDSELRESLRVENDPHAPIDRKMSTPGRIRAFLRFSRNDTNEGTPRARRLSSIFRKK